MTQLLLNSDIWLHCFCLCFIKIGALAITAVRRKQFPYVAAEDA